MATEIKLPRLGQGMESGTIIKWLKSEGDSVEKGEPLYELDTDKVTQEVEADASGVLLKIAVQEGDVQVGKTIAVIGEAGEKVEVPKEAEPQKEEPKRVREAASAVTEIRQSSRTDGRVKASPLARRIARERGIDLAGVRGTGPEGRVVAEDVERATTGAPAPAAAAVGRAEIETRPLSSMRRTIARRLTEAWQIPVFHLFVSVDMTRALSLRERLVELHADVRPTISDLLTKVCAAALMRHRDVNASFTDEGIQIHPSANVGIAVAVPDGLIVPVIDECERKSIAEIAAARADLVERARDGKLKQSDLEGGTFTISNLGMYGVERFTAVINPPQAAILAVGAVQEKPVAADGQVGVRPQMDLMLTCDHRALNGAVGADFLGSVKAFLEEPGLAL
jgi:pyruvate dehydrogenase E2 component (dihydrolipoyllysine-residue acetyltransferase)